MHLLLLPGFSEHGLFQAAARFLSTISQSLRPTMEAAFCFSVTLSYIDVLNNNNYEVFCAVSPD